MKTRISAIVLSGMLTFLIPGISFAAIQSLNGLSANTQDFATSTAPNSPHLVVQSSGSTHTFKWDGTPWLLSQGGTGATSFATGSIPFINNGVFSQNSLQLFWDAVSSILNVGGTTTPSAKLSVRGSSGLGLLNLSTTGGANAVYVAEAGDVGIGNSAPLSKLDVAGSIYSRLVNDSDGSSTAIDWSSGNVHSLVLNTATTNLSFSNGQAGGEYTLLLKQDATGGRAVTWPGSVVWEGGNTPVLTSTASTTDIATFIFDGTNYLGSIKSNYNTAKTVNVLVVGGGGGGGTSKGTSYGGAGGGGAGGYRTNSAFAVAVQSYTVTIGGGGAGGAAGGNPGTSGATSTFATISANGGGGGGKHNDDGNRDGLPGGSGGGSANTGTGGTGNSPSTSPAQGHDGGSSSGNGGAGGGGASAAGSGATTNTGANGGAGTSNSISGSAVTYAGGGGGAGDDAENAGGSGGAGGGGAGGAGGGNTGTAGTANTGGGGGGGSDGALGGDGGSGIVIISYPTGSITATGGTVTTSGGYTIHTFTSSGTFQVTAI